MNGRIHNYLSAKRSACDFTLKLIVVLALLVCVCACSTSRSKKRGASMSTAGKEAAKKPGDQKVIGSNEQGRPDMSDAGREAQKNPNDQRVVDSDEPEQRQPATDEQTGVVETGVALGGSGGEQVEYHESGESTDPHTPQQDDKPAFHLGLIGGYGNLTGDEINAYPTIGLAFGLTSKSDRVGMELRAMVGFPRLTGATGISQGVEDEEELAIDGLVRLYTTPIHTFVGFCFIGGLRWSMLNWQYKNPIVYDDGYDVYEVNSDNIQSITPFLGIGLNLIQMRHFTLGTDLTGGYKFYKWNTEEGFDNDVLDDEWMVQLLLSVSFAWGR